MGFYHFHQFHGFHDFEITRFEELEREYMYRKYREVSLKGNIFKFLIPEKKKTIDEPMECLSVDNLERMDRLEVCISTINEMKRLVHHIRLNMYQPFFEERKPKPIFIMLSIDDELRQSIKSFDDMTRHSKKSISTLQRLQLLIAELTLSCNYDTMEQQYQRWLYYLYLLLIILVWSGGGKRNYESLSLVIFLSFLLIISGRIELNPGPTLGEILKLVLRENFHLLSEAIQTCLPDIAKELYAKGFITKCTRNSQRSCAMIDEFEIINSTIPKMWSNWKSTVNPSWIVSPVKVALLLTFLESLPENGLNESIKNSA